MKNRTAHLRAEKPRRGTGPTKARHGVTLREENVGRKSCPNTRTETRQRGNEAPATQRPLRDKPSHGAPAAENRDTRFTRSTAPKTRGGARRAFCDRRRGTLWAKSISGKKTETQIQATRAAAHEEKPSERKIAAKDSALAVAARLLRREASGAATLAQYHLNSNWAGPLCMGENQSRKLLRENSSAGRERIKSALGQIRNQKSPRKMESPDVK
jgi:hypothetical protein